MSDLLVFSVLAACMLWALREPWIGVITWSWVSLMSPHVLIGWRAASWPVASGVALCTLIGLLLTRKRQNPFVGSAVWALLAFTLWITITLPFSMYFDEALPLWERSMKIFLMLFVTLSLIDTRRKLDVFVGINVVSIGFYGVKGGIFTILTAGAYRVWGPGGFIAGNNELALAVVTTIPLIRYLQLQFKVRWMRLAAGVAMGLCVVTALGTYSRGALLGLAAMSAYFWIQSRKKVQRGVLILVVGAAALALMPEQWFSRMDTIGDYSADDSALGRINAWWMAWNLAKDNVFGGGFMIYYAPVFQKYSPDPSRVHAAHSIYFQVMGEHGFIGLLLFLLIGVLTWLSARSLIKAGRANASHRWAADLGAMVQVSMVGYAVAGAFLSLSYFDLPYNVMAMSVLALYFVRRDDEAARAAARAGLSVNAPADWAVNAAGRPAVPHRAVALPRGPAAAPEPQHDRP